MPQKQAKGPKIPKNNYKLAETIPFGTLFTDFQKRQWTVGKVIGSGGFGLIYLASAGDKLSEGDTAEHVMKVEPNESGPLFTENAFYTRVGKPDLISAWITKKKLPYLGIPPAISSGKHELNGLKYRFMIMGRFGLDLQKCFESNNKRFSRKGVHQIAISLLNTLEYVHSYGYVHADIKASNLLLGFKKSCENQIYLVDYGLATKYTFDKGHNAYVEDPSAVHDGTIEFTSIDAHKGAKPSRRGDLEILGYCLLQWLCGALPWETNLNNKDFVKNEKIRFSRDIPGLMKACFPSSDVPEEIATYFKDVVKLEYPEQPNYEHFRKIFSDSARKLKLQLDGKLDLQSISTPKNKMGSKKRSLNDGSNSSSPEKSPRKSLSPVKKTRISPKVSKGKKSKSVSKKEVLKESNSSNKMSPRTKQVIYPVLTNPPLTSSLPTKKVVSPKVSNPTAKKKKTIVGKAVKSTSTGTQTSPGLKGLLRSRKPVGK